MDQFSFNPTFHRAHFNIIPTPFNFNQALSRARFVVIQIRSGPVQFQPYIPSGTFYSHPDPIQFQPSTQSGLFCCHPDTIWPSSVSTIVSITTSDWQGADLISNLDIIYIYILARSLLSRLTCSCAQKCQAASYDLAAFRTVLVSTATRIGKYWLRPRSVGILPQLGRLICKIWGAPAAGAYDL